MQYGTASVTRPLTVTPIACERVGEMVRWMSGSCSVEVALTGGSLDARFFGASACDEATGEMLVPVYDRDGSSYELDRLGSERMGRDIEAFFAGEREPAFRFASFESR